MAYPNPSSCGLGKEEILTVAENVFSTLKLYPAANLENIVTFLRGNIEYFSFQDGQRRIASIRVEEGGQFKIRLSSFIFPLQKRFAIAHELGHFFLHSKCGRIPIEAYHDDYWGNSIVEREASVFAAGFLMPKRSLEMAKKRFNCDSLQIASYFMIPEPIVRQFI